jgi:hypothetical protein
MEGKGQRREGRLQVVSSPRRVSIAQECGCGKRRIQCILFGVEAPRKNPLARPKINASITLRSSLATCYTIFACCNVAPFHTFIICTNIT